MVKSAIAPDGHHIRKPFQRIARRAMARAPSAARGTVGAFPLTDGQCMH